MVFICLCCATRTVCSLPLYPRIAWYLHQSGGLAREQIRDALSPNPPDSSDQWSLFNHHALHTRPLGACAESSPAKIALYFPLPEIVPNVYAGTYRYTYAGQQPTVSPPSAWEIPEDDCRAIIESQLLSLRLRSRGIVAPPSPNPQNVPAQPRRVYLVGGGSQNIAIAKLAGEILGGVEGVYRYVPLGVMPGLESQEL